MRGETGWERAVQMDGWRDGKLDRWMEGWLVDGWKDG